MTSVSDLQDWKLLPAKVPSLPGQLDLFADCEDRGFRTIDELFETGRDLPGADERDQRIIWDVAQ